MLPDDFPQSTMSSVLDRAGIAYFDGRLPETAILIAQEAARRNIPILIDAERKRERLDDFLKLTNYAVCSAKFPQASLLFNEILLMVELVWTEAPSIPSALVSMLLRLPNLKFVIVTLGENGCIMLERSKNEGAELEEVDVESLLESLNQRKDESVAFPTCVSSLETKLRADGIGTVSGRLFIGTAEKIPPSELSDTTGAGDAFIGAVLYGKLTIPSNMLIYLRFQSICANMPPEKMLPFAAQVAALGCRALGARTGLPHRSHPRLESFF
ncbi:hypothetical protein Patl1_01677 [Pistacia atlantica]|uniref:Uncharacterized protein n=1 Tax=Pistacia atlantica TaxID=434234 RepID=A0ACC1CC16_9ROSI|nr:hypothetical protein Patl1_01677 [Pistacia atlantica]